MKIQKVEKWSKKYSDKIQRENNNEIRLKKQIYKSFDNTEKQSRVCRNQNKKLKVKVK